MPFQTKANKSLIKKASKRKKRSLQVSVAHSHSKTSSSWVSDKGNESTRIVQVSIQIQNQKKPKKDYMIIILICLVCLNLILNLIVLGILHSKRSIPFDQLLNTPLVIKETTILEIIKEYTPQFNSSMVDPIYNYSQISLLGKEELQRFNSSLIIPYSQEKIKMFNSSYYSFIQSRFLKRFTENGQEFVGLADGSTLADCADYKTNFFYVISDYYKTEIKRGLTVYCDMDEAKEIFPSCSFIMNLGLSSGDGVYSIKMNSNTPILDVYCEMSTYYGGWTLVIGPGLRFGYSHSFWSESYSSNEEFSFRNVLFTTSSSSLILKNLKFGDLYFYISSSEYGIFKSSSSSSTFIEKKNNAYEWTLMTGTFENNLIWNSEDNSGYSIGRFLLGIIGSYVNFNDYYHYFIGGNVSPNRNVNEGKFGHVYDFYNQDSDNCNNDASSMPDEFGCISGNIVRFYGIGKVGHRYSYEYENSGMFFRDNNFTTLSAESSCAEHEKYNRTIPGYYTIEESEGDKYQFYCYFDSIDDE